MSTARRETQIVSGLIDRLSLSQPVDADARGAMSASKKRVMKRVMKSVGALGLLSGIYLSVYLSLKKLGLLGSVLKVLMAVTLSSAVAYGGYRAVISIMSMSSMKSEKSDVVTAKTDVGAAMPQEKKPAEPAKVLKTETIFLYDGRIIKGTIISRGAQFKIQTSRGVISIPRDSVQRTE